jgi:hypothetical protein
MKTKKKGEKGEKREEKPPAKKHVEKSCVVSICEDPVTGRITMRPEGCNSDEVLKYMKKIKEQHGIDLEL